MQIGKFGFVGLLAAITAAGVGCAHQISYVPVGPGSSGGPAARYPVPPESPQGEVYVTSFGVTDMDVGPNQPGGMLHTRLAVSNGSGTAWNVDGRQQFLAVPGGAAPQPPAYLNTDAAGAGPVYQVPPGRASVFDLYFSLPPGVDPARGLGGFALDWSVDTGGRLVASQTSFQRSEGAPPAYGGYPPYVVVGLGFGPGWWYYPGFLAHHRRWPVVRRYYGPGHAPAGAWRGTPSPGWRATPPSGGWHGTPVPSGPAPRGRSSGGRGGGWRGGGHR
jgi:hypothetical protein